MNDTQKDTKKKDKKDEKKFRDMLKDTPGVDKPSGGSSSGGGSGISLRPLIIWLAVIVVLILAITLYQRNQTPGITMEASEFIDQVANSNIVSVVFEQDSINVHGKIRLNPKDLSINPKWIQNLGLKEERIVPYKSSVVSEDAKNEIAKVLKAQKADFNSEQSSQIWSHILFSFLPVILIIAIIAFMINRQMKRGMGMAMNFGRSRAKQNVKGDKRITFKDLAGCDEAKEEVSELIDYLKDPKKFEALGGRIPRGVILIGPPGTGKTLLAKAVAGEAEVPFFTISGSDFVEMFVGVGAARVRDLFEQGKRSAPCIIFVDEIDAVGRRRGAGLGGGHDEREQTLNALLVEMDGFSENDGVILIAATNRPDVLDPALLRPGRFDRQIVIDMPDLNGREKILEIHAKKVKLSDEVDLSRIARGTPGFSGADLSNVINEAALLAAREDCKAVEQHHLEEARDKVRFGRERRSRAMDDEDKKITAYHEGGHALVMAKIPECEPLHKVTIIPRGIAYLGATMQLPIKDKYHYTKKEIEGQLASLFGGRVAEKIVFDDITSGAKSDIKNATEIARRMVCEWGMSDSLGPLAYGEREEHLFLGREIDKHVDYSDDTAHKIDKEVRAIIDAAVQRAMDIITTHRDALDRIADALMQFEVLEGEEINDLIDNKPIRQNNKEEETSADETSEDETSEDELPGIETPEEETSEEQNNDTHTQ